MFVFNRNILAVTKYMKGLCKNTTGIDENSLGLFRLLQQKFPKQPTRDCSSVTNTTSVQKTAESTNEQKSEEPHLFNYDTVTKGNKELEHKLKVIMLETEVLRQDGHPIPSFEYIKPDMWEILLNAPTRSQRRKYLEYLFKNSKKKENEMLKKLEKRKETEEMRATLPPRGQKNLSIEEIASQYGLSHNHIFLRFHDGTVNHMYNNRLIQAMQFGQKLVIDCGYDQNMSRRENYNCAKQLMLLFAENRYSDQPFDIHFTNVNRESDLFKMLHKYIPTMYDLEFPMNTHEKSYLDLFPKENLVYLTPHCREEMENYDPDAVYIIGALVDKINNEPLSLAKAKREGIKMKKFPLDRYLQWSSGSGKSLTLNHCTSILLDIKDTGDWNRALRHVPKRKIIDPNTYKNVGPANEYNRFNSNKDSSRWKPKSYKKPSYMKNDR